MSEKAISTTVEYTHLIVIIFAWASPFLLSWPVVAIGTGLHHLQNLVVKDCVLNLVHFKDKREKTNFHAYMLGKLGFNVSNHKIEPFTVFIIPSVILIIALLWQLVFSNNPLWF